ncbi:unnamed protein product [Nyctereutes procyonoides]|uniref:(raccoon dog) hypothetical protein n=1 Tax=Nyctereutes procyonoides TaxID=34880 RepID=A0A811YUL1_NYCPR|nr:unnamed protein product [Nyctereutes procyonoides]
MEDIYSISIHLSVLAPALLLLAWFIWKSQHFSDDQATQFLIVALYPKALEASMTAFHCSTAGLCGDRILDTDGPKESSVLLQFLRGNSEASRRSYLGSTAVQKQMILLQTNYQMALPKALTTFLSSFIQIPHDLCI